MLMIDDMPETKNINQRGLIMPIGGREDKEVNLSILAKYVEFCGGENAIISVIPTASNLTDTGSIYVEIFKRLGVCEVYNINIANRTDANNEIYENYLSKSTGIFMTGGNQLLLSAILGGTKIARAIRRRNLDGVTVAGTSAGAAFIPEHMIAAGESGLTPRVGGVELAPGLGLINKVMIDQHFSERNRLGRLLTALSYNPYKTGIGVDEDTAAIITAEGNIEAFGSGALTIIDMSKVEFTSIAQTRPGQLINMVGVITHTLLEGDKYNYKLNQIVYQKGLLK